VTARPTPRRRRGAVGRRSPDVRHRLVPDVRHGLVSDVRPGFGGDAAI